MPYFTVIAGPNGAGKSTFSSYLSGSGTLIFDPDKQKLLIEKQYPDISEDAQESAITRSYTAFEQQALAEKRHFTVETNLRNDFLAGRAAFFKTQDYQRNLIFMLLPDIASSMDRVNLRVKQKGHYVDAESIRYNFNESLKNLVLIAPQFDNVMLVCAAANYGIISVPEMLCVWKSGRISKLNSHIPEWAESTVKKLSLVLQSTERKPWERDEPSSERGKGPGALNLG